MKKKSLYLKLLIFFLVLVYFAYMLEQQRDEIIFDHEKYQGEHLIEDIEKYKQDLNYYAEKLPDEPLLTEKALKKYQEEFYALYFAPWSQEKTLITLEEISSIFNRKSPAYAENLKLWQEDKWQELFDNADLMAFPNANKKAITLRQTPLRAVPSMKPLFLEAQSLSNAYPFDMFQYSHLSLALPLYVSHMSKDKAWAFVDTGNASGWIQSKDIAIIDEEFIENYLTFELVALVKEKSTLLADSHFHALASIGTLLPMKEDIVYAPFKEIGQGTKLYPVDINKENYENFPLDYRAKKVATLGQEMMGQAYGWGGFLGNRDCSLMLQDLFVPFGIYLPRNSALQAKIGNVHSLENVKNKKEEIHEKAKPFASLLYKKGHIMLYIGQDGQDEQDEQDEQEAMIFHNAWAVPAKKNERVLVGKALVSSLELGQENPRAEKKKSLLNTLKSINNF